MILKKREFPQRILINEALKRRLPTHHPKMADIESDLNKGRAGYRGELAVDYYLNFLPKDRYAIFQDLRLANGEFYFQIDTLLLSPNFALVIEIKNIAGSLYFDHQSEQLTRTFKDVEEGMLNPIHQAKQQVRQLTHFLQQHSFPPLPIHFFVVISHPTTILKASHSKIFQTVIHSHSLLDKMDGLEKGLTEEKLDAKAYRKLSRLLLKQNETYLYDFQKIYSIDTSEIMTGVQCPTCQTTALFKIRKGWHCAKCNSYSADAHLQALQDYCLLISKNISTRELKRFLQVTSRHVSETLLKNMTTTGIGKKTTYNLEVNT